MKNKIICLLTCAILILATILVNYLSSNNLIRHHQHEENNKEIKTDDVEEFNTHLPIISINTDGEEIPGEDGENDTIISNVKIYNNTSSVENNYLTDEASLETLSKIRIRGSTSRSFDKKNYLLKFINNDGTQNSQKVVGMAAHDEWILHGPFLDKTLIRNYMWYNIGGEIMSYAPNVRFCELFINDEYLGIYVIEESVSAGINRINIAKPKNSAKSTGYIIRLDRGSSNEYRVLNNFTKYNHYIAIDRFIDVIYPKIDEDNQQLKTYIEQDFNEFERILYSDDYKEYSQYIDVDSFVEYFIINEFTQNYDAGDLSTYLYKEINGKLKLCIWDFNSACDNYVINQMDGTGFTLTNAVWFERLLKDEDFVEKIISKYNKLRKTYLSEEYLYEYIDKTVEYLGDAVNRNYEVWGYTFDKENDLLEDGRKIGSYEEAINQMKNFIHTRGEWLDEHIEDLYLYTQ